MADAIHYIISGVLTLGGGGLFFYGFNRLSKFQLMHDTPTSKIRSMAMGIVEIKGKASAKTYIKAPFSNDNCVYYEYEIKEYRRHTTTDSKGNLRTNYSWDTISTGKRHVPFFTDDGTGSVLVSPNNAEFNVKIHKAFYQKAGLFGGFSRLVSTLKNLNKGIKGTIDTQRMHLTPIDCKKHFFWGARVGDRRYYEYVISSEEQVYILGTAVTDSKAPNNIIIKKGSNEKTFLISDRSEEELTKKLKIQLILSFIFGGLLILGGVVLGYLSLTGKMV